MNKFPDTQNELSPLFVHSSVLGLIMISNIINKKLLTENIQLAKAKM